MTTPQLNNKAIPPGIIVKPNAISISTAKTIQTWLQNYPNIPWERAIEGRRVAQYGVRYDYASQSVDATPVAPIPTHLKEWLSLTPASRFTQCIINEYGPEDEIPYHVDDLAFGETIAVFCLGECRPLLLRRIDGAKKECVVVSLPERSSYEMWGEARYEWQHAIPTGRGWRISITFRSLKVEDDDDKEEGSTLS